MLAKVKPQGAGEPERKTLGAEAGMPKQSARKGLRTLVLSWTQFLSAGFTESRCGPLAGPARALKDARAGSAQPL